MKRTQSIIDVAKASRSKTALKVGKRRLVHKETMEVRPAGNISSLAKAPWKHQGDIRPHFIFTLENGCYEVQVDNWRLYQNYFNEIIQDLDMKYLVHLRHDQYIGYPKWDKRVHIINLIGQYPMYRKGV